MSGRWGTRDWGGLFILETVHGELHALSGFERQRQSFHLSDLSMSNHHAIFALPNLLS